MTTEATEHRYLQVARTLRKEIVDGIYPVGSQLPTEHELCERFAVSRYTVREALRRLREDNLVSSRPRTGTQVIPRTSSSSYAQDVMSIDDLLAFAAGAQFDIESNAMITIDAETAERTGLDIGEQWLAVSGYRRATDGNPICRTEYYINRASPRSAVCYNAIRARSSRSSKTCSVSASSTYTRRSPPSWCPTTWPPHCASPRARRRCRCSAPIRPPTVRSPRSP